MKFFLLSLLIAAVSAQTTSAPSAPPTTQGGTYCKCTFSLIGRAIDGDDDNKMLGAPYGNGSPQDGTSGANFPCLKAPGSGDPACTSVEACASTTGRPANYGQECGEVKTNATLNYVIAKGNSVCPRFRYLSKRGDPDDGDTASDTISALAGWATGCGPSQSCCNGQCCDTNEACMTMTGASTMPNAAGGPGGAGQFLYDFAYWNVAKVARNDWKLGDNRELKNKPMMCMSQDIWLNATAGMKVVFLPVVGIVLIALCFMQANGKKTGEMMDNMAPMLMMVFGFFLMFSHHIGFALLCVIMAAATMCASPSWSGWVLFFQVSVFFFIAGGKSFFIDNDATTAVGWFNADNNVFTSYLNKDITALTGTCVKYYNFFKYGHNMKWMTNSVDRTSWGYCSQEWVSFEIFNCTMQMLAFMFMIVQTAVKAVSGGGDGRTSQALSAAKV